MLADRMILHGTYGWCFALVMLGFALIFSRALARERGAPQDVNFTYFVDSTSDAGNNDRDPTVCDDGTGHCTLRGAIQLANNRAGADVINIGLPAGSVINLGSPLPDIAGAVSISGPGPDKLTVRRNTGGNYRVFNVTAGPVTFSGLTISNAVMAGDGGGINKNSATVNVTNCAFVGNIAQRGAGIFNTSGTLNVTNCTFTGNIASADGGGISNLSGTANVVSSTFSGNSANNSDPTSSGGGAICNGDFVHSFSGVLNVTNSTIIRNTAFTGGGITSAHLSTATVTNCTISENSSLRSDRGGGIANIANGPFNLKSSIVALSTGASRPDVSGAFITGGFNLVGKADGSTGLTAATDQTGTIASPLDPKLDPAGLQNNGGATQTIALQIGSPAIDKGSSVGLTGNLTTDQRGSGFPRAADYSNVANATGGDAADIGAFEGTALKITSIARLANGHILLQGLGTPNRPHAVEASPSLAPNSFTSFPSMPMADGTGVLQFDDATAASPTKQFYRLRFP